MSPESDLQLLQTGISLDIYKYVRIYENIGVYV